MLNHESMNHSANLPMESKSTPTEYLKFLAVIFTIIMIAFFATTISGEFAFAKFLKLFMGTFFLVFGFFKLLDLRGFAASYSGYDIVAKSIFAYGYIYPFIEIALALGYFFSVPYVDWATLLLMSVGSVGVFTELARGSKIKCACLGTYIKLPLTTISLVENVAMGLMALAIILKLI